MRQTKPDPSVKPPNFIEFNEGYDPKAGRRGPPTASAVLSERPAMPGLFRALLKHLQTRLQMGRVKTLNQKIEETFQTETACRRTLVTLIAEREVLLQLLRDRQAELRKRAGGV